MQLTTLNRASQRRLRAAALRIAHGAGDGRDTHAPEARQLVQAKGALVARAQPRRRAGSTMFGTLLGLCKSEQARAGIGVVIAT